MQTILCIMVERCNYTDLGYVRAAAVAPPVALADPLTNAATMCAQLSELSDAGVAIAVFPELCLTGYSAEDLFHSGGVLRDVRAALRVLLAHEHTVPAVVVGLPWRLPDGRLLNCAAVLAAGRVRGMVPKLALPNYGEFYERRWFVSGDGVDVEEICTDFGTFRISARQLFQVGPCRFGIELCEDLWSPQPPASTLALGGAQLILNLSASNELVAKADYRRDLVRMSSAATICGYLYASSGVTESTKDVVYGGHLIACENGAVLGESDRFRFEAQQLVVEFDLEKLDHDRMQNTTFANATRGAPLPVSPCGRLPELSDLKRSYPDAPFVPTDEASFDARAREILAIQACGLARRIMAARADRIVIGLSGGLDSTLAFLVCLDAMVQLERPFEHLLAVTMPGPGTTERTRGSARDLADAGGATLVEISIEAAVEQHLRDLGHQGEHDVVFENAQARERTQILFNYANQQSGLVVGTGDLSELALGWCTYNADHMASYNVNASVPKTMIAYLVRWYARHRASPAVAEVLDRVLRTPISPELLPPEDGQIAQETESLVGPYELHDFFLFHFLRNGFSATKIYRLACRSFGPRMDRRTVKRWLGEFFRRFFAQQFKRTTLPAGPKVGSVSLSPRGDWRMPDEVDASRVLAEIAGLPD